MFEKMTDEEIEQARADNRAYSAERERIRDGWRQDTADFRRRMLNELLRHIDRDLAGGPFRQGQPALNYSIPSLLPRLVEELGELGAAIDQCRGNKDGFRRIQAEAVDVANLAMILWRTAGWELDDHGEPKGPGGEE